VSHTIQALLRRLRGADPAAEAADADLLERFTARRDPVAFADLVARHGPMVLGVCQRLLRDAHDAEDAFQATFLVLARRAGGLRRGDPLGPWLYGVACRTAAHARASRARRHDRERRASAMSPAAEPTPSLLWEDLRPVLDEEIRRLPEAYRVPVILCYLAGKTYDEAAREIGCAKGTVATRLLKARRVLRDRLSQRGLALPSAGLPALLAGNSRAALPAALLQSTIQSATTSAAPPAVAALTAEVLKTMTVSKTKVLAAVVATGVALAAGAGTLAYRAAAGDPARPGGGAPPAAEAAADEPPWGDEHGGLQVRARARQARWAAGETIAFDIDLRNRAADPRQVYPPVGLWPLWEVEIDGVWFGRKQTLPPGAIDETPPKHLLDISRPTSLKAGEAVKGWTVLRLDGVWQKDVPQTGRRIADAPERPLALAPGRHTVRVAYHYSDLHRPVSNSVEIEVVAAGGKADPGWVRVRVDAGDKTYLFRPDGTGRAEAASGPAGRLPSPDGKGVVYVVGAGNESAIHVADADGKNARKVSPDGVVAAFPIWSPDGKRITFLGTRGVSSHVHVMDRDGRNVRPITDADSAPHGAVLPKFGAGGRLAYLVYGQRVGKRQPADLVIGEGKTAKAAVTGEVIADYAWSPDGAVIAYSRPGGIVFHDLAAGKGQEVALKGIDERLADHAALDISWSPDGRAVACRMVFWGGRQANGPKMLGDEEVFVIPRDGKPTWFDAGGPVRGVEWVRGEPAKEPVRPPAAEPPLAAGDWSEPVDGLRGRLLLGQGRSLPDLKARETLVYVEIEEVADAYAGDRAVYFDPAALQCKLAQADGKPVPEHPSGGSGGRGGPPAGWVTIPSDAMMRLRANPSGYGTPDGLHIALANAHYLLKTGETGEYRLSGTLTVTPPAGHGRANAWAGVLKLPPVKVRAPAPARPSVTDTASGITVTLQEDGRTIVACGTDGKTVWEADVIKTTGIPFVGAPAVRDLQAKNGKVTAVYGKHSFADFDLATGQFLGAGSD